MTTHRCIRSGHTAKHTHNATVSRRACFRQRDTDACVGSNAAVTLPSKRHWHFVLINRTSWLHACEPRVPPCWPRERGRGVSSPWECVTPSVPPSRTECPCLGSARPAAGTGCWGSPRHSRRKTCKHNRCQTNNQCQPISIQKRRSIDSSSSMKWSSTRYVPMWHQFKKLLKTHLFKRAFHLMTLI